MSMLESTCDVPCLAFALAEDGQRSFRLRAVTLMAIHQELGI